MADAKSTPKTAPGTQRHLLIADANKSRYLDFMKLLGEADIVVQHISKREEIVPTAMGFAPEIVIINLFVEGNTIGLIRDIRNALAKNDVKILVVTAHKSRSNIEECVKAGANDFVVEPFDPKLLFQRVRYQLQEREVYAVDDLKADPSQALEGFQLIYDCMRLLAEVKDGGRAMYECLKRIAEMCKSNRVNVIMGDLEDDDGMVVATSDDEKLRDLKVDIEKYPEVREVLTNGSIVYVKDITQNPLTKNIKEQVKTIDIVSLIVFPVRHRGVTLGALCIRLGADGLQITDKHLKTFYMLALSIGPKVAGRRLLKRMNKPSTP